MSVEELLGLLRDKGLDDEGIKGLLTEAIASLEGPAEEAPVADENADAMEAGKLLGVEF